MSARLLRHASLCALLAASLPLCHAAKAENHYDAAKDFRLKANPNGVWSYLTYDVETLLNHAHDSYEHISGLENWSNDAPTTEAESVIVNKTGGSVSLENGTTVIPAGYLSLAPQFGGAFVGVRFQAPSAGTYVVICHVNGISTVARDVNHLFVDQNNQEIRRVQIQSGVHKRFKLTLTMAAGDTLDFQENRNNQFKPDYMGLQIKIKGP